MVGGSPRYSTSVVAHGFVGFATGTGRIVGSILNFRAVARPLALTRGGAPSTASRRAARDRARAETGLTFQPSSARDVESAVAALRRGRPSLSTRQQVEHDGEKHGDDDRGRNRKKDAHVAHAKREVAR